MYIYFIIMLLSLYLVDVKFKLQIFQTLFGLMITVIFYIFYIIFTLYDVYLFIKHQYYRYRK
jgi:hypothetical protein